MRLLPVLVALTLSNGVLGIEPIPQLAIIKSPNGVGTGTLIAKVNGYAFWITAYHVAHNSQRLVIDNLTNQWQAKVVAYDYRADISLAISGGEKTPDPILVWTGDLSRSSDYYSEGYAKGTIKYFGRRKGKLLSQGEKQASWSLPSMRGDSGGPVYAVYNHRIYLTGITATSSTARVHPSVTVDGSTSGANPKSIWGLLDQAGLQVDKTGKVLLKKLNTHEQEVLAGRGWIFPLKRRHSHPGGGT